MTKRRITILGATGSVGCSTLDLIDRNRDAYDLVAITANINVEKLIEQARAFRPRYAVIADANKYQALREGLAGLDTEAMAGSEALLEVASQADWVMAAIVGVAGLAPTLAAVRAGAVVAIANKECLVCAGEFLMDEAARCGATILPADSEHNAIFQLFDFDRPGQVEKIIITASGGPFRLMSRDEMSKVTPQQAIAHPVWSMGVKISVDSATMMNKGLELIEARRLFPIKNEQIEVLVHPQSIIHSLVAYVDGSVLAQLGSPDMRIPIAHVLAWPHRIQTPAPRLDLSSIGQLTFEAADTGRFPALRLAHLALNAGGSVPTVLNAANEIAVAAFLEGRIGFLDIIQLVEETMAVTDAAPVTDLQGVMDIDEAARRHASALIARQEGKGRLLGTRL